MAVGEHLPAPASRPVVRSFSQSSRDSLLNKIRAQARTRKKIPETVAFIQTGLVSFPGESSVVVCSPVTTQSGDLPFPAAIH